MNGWTPEHVLGLGRFWHERLIAMLLKDQAKPAGKPGFSLNEGFIDR